MPLNSNDPQNIILNTRCSEINLGTLTEYVVSMARYLVEQSIAAQSIITPAPIATTFSKQSRSLDTDFVVSNCRNALVFYTIELTTHLTLSGTDSVYVDMKVDGVTLCTIKNLLTLALGILSLGMTQTHQKILMGYVPGGSTVNLTTTSNNGTATIIQCMEVLL